jgi:hypothetical protein
MNGVPWPVVTHSLVIYLDGESLLRLSKTNRQMTLLRGMEHLWSICLADAFNRRWQQLPPPPSHQLAIKLFLSSTLTIYSAETAPQPVPSLSSSCSLSSYSRWLVFSSSAIDNNRPLIWMNMEGKLVDAILDTPRDSKLIALTPPYTKDPQPTPTIQSVLPSHNINGTTISSPSSSIALSMLGSATSSSILTTNTLTLLSSNSSKLPPRGLSSSGYATCASVMAYLWCSRHYYPYFTHYDDMKRGVACSPL